MDTPQLPSQRRLPQPLSDVTQYINPDIHGASMTWAGSQKNMRGSRPDTYKTVICQAWLETGSCTFGENCRFAHGEQELRPMVQNCRNTSKYKTKLCDKYTKTGICPYGNRCLFIHPAPRSGTTYYQTPVAPPQPLMKIPLSHLTSTPLSTAAGAQCTCPHPPQPQKLLSSMDGTPMRPGAGIAFGLRHQPHFHSWLSDPSALNDHQHNYFVSDFGDAGFPVGTSPPMATAIGPVDVGGKQRSMSDSVVGAHWFGSSPESMTDVFETVPKDNSNGADGGFNPFTSVSPFSAMNPFVPKPSPGSNTTTSATSPYSSFSAFSLSSSIWSPDSGARQSPDLMEPVVFPDSSSPFGAPGSFVGRRLVNDDGNMPKFGDAGVAFQTPIITKNPWMDEETKPLLASSDSGSSVRSECSASPFEMLDSLKH